MISLWERAIESGKACVLDEIDLNPEELLSKVEDFESASQAIEHSYPAMIYPNTEAFSTSKAEHGDGDSEYEDYSEDDYDDGKFYGDDSFEAAGSSVPLGSLPIDLITKQLSDGEDEV